MLLGRTLLFVLHRIKYFDFIDILLSHSIYEFICVTAGCFGGVKGQLKPNFLKGARIPAVIRSIVKKTSQHFKQSISVQHHVQQPRFDLYAAVDEGWDDSTQELVTNLFKLSNVSRTLSEIHYRIAILRSKVRQESFLKIIDAIPLPLTGITVIQKTESEQGLDVDRERVHDHMPRPVHFEGMDKAIKLLGSLVQW